MGLFTAGSLALSVRHLFGPNKLKPVENNQFVRQPGEMLIHGTPTGHEAIKNPKTAVKNFIKQDYALPMDIHLEFLARFPNETMRALFPVIVEDATRKYMWENSTNGPDTPVDKVFFPEFSDRASLGYLNEDIYKTLIKKFGTNDLDFVLTKATVHPHFTLAKPQ